MLNVNLLYHFPGIILPLLGICFFTADQLQAKQFSNGTCELSPLYWTIGTVDQKFSITNAELEKIIEEAAALWSDAAGKDLFRKRPFPSDSSLHIQLIYSSDQHQFDTEAEIADSIGDLRRQFYPEQVAYRSQAAVYKKNHELHQKLLVQYNELINNYNEELSRVLVSGARTAREQDRIDNLRSEIERMRPRLAEAEKNLESEEEKLTRLSDELNLLADQINELIYRQNELLGTWTTFRKGTFMNIADRHKINIYQFDNHNELRLILAHEFGHALGLPHVQNTESVMYYRAEHQNGDRLKLTDNDLQALQEACEPK